MGTLERVNRRMLVGVDIGGTFTDLILSEDGRLRIHKLLSTPHNPAEAMLAGLEAIGAVAGARVSHGSTVATNAILERKGAKTALITTKGFRDLLLIGRQNRPVLYALQPQLPPPLIPRELCYEVPERLNYKGTVLKQLDLKALDKVLDAIAAQGVESVAVCLLHSFVNPAHEQAIRERILARGLLEAWQISLSCEVLPEFREYERASTVALDAYVRPIISRYLQQLEDTLPRESHLLVMKSDGGVVSAKTAREQAVQTALSGPAAGVIGAFHIAQTAGYDQIITLDMGGTSTDVALCSGEPARRTDAEIDGLPLRIRLIDIETIGAGGGSIARVDAGGALRVGPQSAGADPGPVIYGRGGDQVTVSDANALLGRLDAEHFLGGGLMLDIKAAQRVMKALAKAMNLSVEAAAQGVLDVANVNIDRALRRVSVARGYDPRDFTLVAFGGAGPLHACAVAERLEMPRVLIPLYPGVLCAYGLLVADVVRDYSRTVLQTNRPLDEMVSEMIAQAQADLQAEGVDEEAMSFHAMVDMRYVGQSFEITVPFGDDIVTAFHQAHEISYGYAMVDRPVEVVNVRLEAVGTVQKPTLNAEAVTDQPGPTPLKQRAGMTHYDRAALLPGMTFEGPALVFQLDSTVYVASGWLARVDAYRNLVLERI
ncbi:MAG: hydantoinase/oxoprolinase family protein [Anaerolineae bacterium]|nr:hydantoinase/oxoprolinase family protein [Anaerolineae bacterium]